MNEFERLVRSKAGCLAATTLQRHERLLRVYLQPAVGTDRSLVAPTGVEPVSQP
jgi:hypothetical protein